MSRRPRVPAVAGRGQHLRPVDRRLRQRRNALRTEESRIMTAKPKRKVIISCAVTGAIHTPSMSPHLPVTPEEIAESSVAAAKAGAAIIHLHARDPVTGKPDQRPEAFTPFLERIKSECDAVINLTTGGSP